MTKRVVVETVTVGQSFGTVGVVLDGRTRERLAETEAVGFGNTGRARRDAEALAADRGWTVVDVDVEAE